MVTYMISRKDEVLTHIMVVWWRQLWGCRVTGPFDGGLNGFDDSVGNGP